MGILQTVAAISSLANRGRNLCSIEQPRCLSSSIVSLDLHLRSGPSIFSKQCVMTSIGKAALQPAYCLLLMSSWVFLVLADCIPQQSPPVKIAVRNVTLPGQLVGRGAAVSVGSPPQALAFELNTSVLILAVLLTSP